MNDRPHDEDRTIDEILEACAGGDEDPAGPAGADETLRRLDLEALGLLAYSADPASPDPASRSRVLAAVAGEEPTAAAAVSDQPPPSEPRRQPPAFERPSEPVGGRTRWGAWASLAAAVFALAALGLAGVLWVELDRSRETLDRLVREQGQLEERLARQDRVQQTLVRQADRLSRVMRVASTPGVEICPLRPVGDRPIAPGAFAVLYMPPGEEAWYLVVSGLEPAQGGMYKVWLETTEGPVQAAVIEDGDRADGRLTVQIPPDLVEEGRMLSAVVTLEEGAGSEAPTGPMVLYGDEKMQVL